MPISFQNRYRFRFALSIFCVLFLKVSMSLSVDNAPPPRRIIAYVCMNPKCQQSFSNLFSYDQHRTHAKNINTLCANLTMRREIVATRRAGVTTSVITKIPHRGEHRLICREWKLDVGGQYYYLKKLEEGA